MNEKIKQILEEDKKIKEEKRNNTLIKLGLYEIEYAPLQINCSGIITEGENTGVKVQFTLKDTDVCVGDTISINLNGTKNTVKIENFYYSEIPLTGNMASEYRFEAEDSDLGFFRHYKKIPLQISDSEYNQLIHTAIAKKSSPHIIRNVFYVIAIIIYVLGFIGGIMYGSIYKVDGIFNFPLMFGIWVSILTIGTPLLGIGKIIELLENLNDKIVS